ncbi:MAG TPA: trigger factor [Polyangiaceae bacterium]|jgi:trigger factor
MQVQVARISPVVMELAVEVPAPEVKAEVEKAYSTLQRKAHVKGFRPGKAPRQVLVRLYGPQVASDVMNSLVQVTLPKALTDQKVTPINQPQVEAGKFDQGAAFSYKARFEVQPEIENVDYEGLELARPPVIADEKMVDEQLELLRKQHARLEAPEPARPAEKGDVVTIDFTLDVDGAPMKEAGSEAVQLELGSGQVLPELDAALTGKSIDDAFDVEAKLPDTNPREELRGKPSTFHVKVKDVKQRVLPALDDELAKDIGNFQTLVELRADVHTRLQKMMKDQSDTTVAEQIVDQLSTRNPIDVPPSLIEQQCRMMEMELLQNARRMGQRPSQEDFQKVHGQVHADAEKKVRAGLLMAAIARKLGITVDDKDIQKGLEELAVETGKNVAKVRAEYNDPQRRQILVGMILEDKVLDVIEGKATIREGHPEPKTAEVKTDSQEPASKAKKKGKPAKDTESGSEERR